MRPGGEEYVAYCGRRNPCGRWAVRCGLAGRWVIVAWVGGAATAPYRWKGAWRGEKPGFWVGGAGWGRGKETRFLSSRWGRLPLNLLQQGLGDGVVGENGGLPSGNDGLQKTDKVT